MKKHAIRIISVSLLILIISLCALAFFSFEDRCDRVRDGVFRLHILADSDSEDDQRIKLCVRDMILENGGSLFDGASNKEEAVAMAEKKLKIIGDMCREELKREGCSDSVTVSTGKSIFNTRTYDGYTLPAGEYDALIITIGSGSGHNWWCVLFPSICFPAASETDAGESFDDNELVEGGETEYRFAFRIVEIYWKICGLFGLRDKD